MTSGFLAAALAAWSWLCWFVPAAPADGPPPPNIVFILADDLGWGDLACYGNKKALTPSIDQLADEGVLFTNYRNAAAICSPTRASILTGRFPASLGIHLAYGPLDKLDEVGQPHYLAPVDLLPQALRAQGYVTGHFGKWHLGKHGAPSLTEYGFDEHRSTLSADGNPKYLHNDAWAWTSSEQIVDDAVAFMRRHAGSGPFYLQVWLAHTHVPLESTPQQAEPYDHLAADAVHGWTNPAQNLYGAITAMDGAVGRLLSAIDDLSIAGNTIVVFCSDNGPESMFNASAGQSAEGHAGPFRGRKGSLYEGGVRSPLIVRGPRIPAGTVSTSVIASVDWLPTFTSLSGALAQHDGEDVTDALLERPWKRTRPVLSEWRFGPRIGAEARINCSPGASIVVGEWKLLRNRDGGRTELYNLASDPMETANRASEFPWLAGQLSSRIVSWQATLPPCLGCEREGDNSYPWPR